MKWIFFALIALCSLPLRAADPRIGPISLVPRLEFTSFAAYLSNRADRAEATNAANQANIASVSNIVNSFTTALTNNASNVLTYSLAVSNNAYTASNALRALLVASDSTTSNGIVSWTVTLANTASNACITYTMTTSNTLVSLIVANDATTSNALRTLVIANDITTSNGVVSVLIANDTTTSNALRTLVIANDTTTSNALRTEFIANDTTTSNALRAVLIANDITTSNGLVTLTRSELNNASNVLWSAISGGEGGFTGFTAGLTNSGVLQTATMRVTGHITEFDTATGGDIILSGGATLGGNLSVAGTFSTGAMTVDSLSVSNAKYAGTNEFIFVDPLAKVRVTITNALATNIVFTISNAADAILLFTVPGALASGPNYTVTFTNIASTSVFNVDGTNLIGAALTFTVTNGTELTASLTSNDFRSTNRIATRYEWRTL